MADTPVVWQETNKSRASKTRRMDRSLTKSIKWACRIDDGFRHPEFAAGTSAPQ
jgi:hypothetical protein